MAYIDKTKRFPWETSTLDKGTWLQNPESARLYKTRRWKAVRMQVIREEKVCRKCKENGVVTVGNVVDHIKPYKDGDNFYDRSNLQLLCQSCHNSKSRTEQKR